MLKGYAVWQRPLGDCAYGVSIVVMDFGLGASRDDSA